jgi:hypothetical protein
VCYKQYLLYCCAIHLISTTRSKNKWFKLITTVLFFTFVPVNTKDRTPPLLPSPGLWCGWRAQVLRRALARGEASAYPAPPPRRVPRAAVFRPRAASVSLPVYIAVWESSKLPRFSCTRSSHPSVATSSFTSAKQMYSLVQTKHMDFFFSRSTIEAKESSDESEFANCDSFFEIPHHN